MTRKQGTCYFLPFSLLVDKGTALFDTLNFFDWMKKLKDRNFGTHFVEHT
jgi:hypothetical protein